MAVDTCDAFRDAIVARQETTYEQDRAAMDQVHSVRDPMVAGFEALRGSQATARAALDSGLEGAVAEAISTALELWAQLRALVPELSTLGVATAGGAQ